MRSLAFHAKVALPQRLNTLPHTTLRNRWGGWPACCPGPRSRGDRPARRPPALRGAARARLPPSRGVEYPPAMPPTARLPAGGAGGRTLGGKWFRERWRFLTRRPRSGWGETPQTGCPRAAAEHTGWGSTP